MRDVIQDAGRWLDEGSALAMATVVDTWGSAPRGIGAKMVISSSGQISGSVSGGCIEGAVAESALEVIANDRPQLLRFGVSDDSAWDVGLACGGNIEVFVEKVEPGLHRFVASLLVEDHPFAIATVIQGPDAWLGSKIIAQRGGRIFGEPGNELEVRLAAAARVGLAEGRSRRMNLEFEDLDIGSIGVFLEVITSAPTLVMVGGVHIAIALAKIAKILGFRTVVVDPRRAFGSQERFEHVDQLIQAWPDAAFKEIEMTSSTAVTLLTHDPKIDDPALAHVLSSPAFYIGALGSRKTHEARRVRLLEAGLPPTRVSQIHAPIGIDIGAHSPEEIAVSIMAEIIASHRDRKPKKPHATSEPN